MTLSHQPCDVSMEAPADYEGLDFQTRAMQQSNVHLTWDEDEPQRAKTLKRKLNTDQLVELQLKEFLASDESETDDDSGADDTEDRLMKKSQKQDMYPALIQSGDGSDESDEEGDDRDMEGTFNSSLENIANAYWKRKTRNQKLFGMSISERRERKKGLIKTGPSIHQMMKAVILIRKFHNLQNNLMTFSLMSLQPLRVKGIKSEAARGEVTFKKRPKKLKQA